MAGAKLGNRVECIYESDDTKSYHVLLSAPNSSAGGFAIGPASGGKWPQSIKHLRGVFGVITGSGTADSAPNTMFLPIASASDALYTGANTTFTVTLPTGAFVYTVTGIKGERRYRLASA